MIREWLKRRFDSTVRSDVRRDSDRFERCPFCGQAFNARDLQQVLPHFEHQLAAGAPRPEKLVRHEDPAVPGGKCRAVPPSAGRLGEGDVRAPRARRQGPQRRWPMGSRRITQR